MDQINLSEISLLKGKVKTDQNLYLFYLNCNKCCSGIQLEKTGKQEETNSSAFQN